MKVSDIIMMLSLIIAIIAIVSEKRRKHLLLKYSWIDIIFYGLIFILINYFVFYTEFYSKGIFIKLLYFDHFGLSNPNHYAYIFSLTGFVMILLKINYTFYPYWKAKDVLKYYKTNIENEDAYTLLDLIENYHLKDIIQQIEQSTDYNPDSTDWFLERFKKRDSKEKIKLYFHLAIKVVFPFSKLNRFYYGRLVLNNVINDPALIELTANSRPYFYAQLFSSFKKKKRDSFPNELANQFLDVLVKNKNFWLIKELKQSDSFDIGQPDWFFDDNRIVSAFIRDVSVADVNEIWRPFGENAIKEIENEFNFGEKSTLVNPYRNDDVLWEFCSHISIKFINILIIEAITQKYKGSHFWLYYYWHITTEILNNLNSFSPINFEETETNYHHLILEMNEFILHWLELSNDNESEGIFHDIITCLGEQIHETLLADCFGEKRKKEFIESILRRYCSFKEKSKTSEIRAKLEEILLKPCMLSKTNHPYYSYIAIVWKSFDKIPHRGYAVNIEFDYFARLKEKVIIPLGLNPDEH